MITNQSPIFTPKLNEWRDLFASPSAFVKSALTWLHHLANAPVISKRNALELRGSLPFLNDVARQNATELASTSTQSRTELASEASKVADEINAKLRKLDGKSKRDRGPWTDEELGRYV